MKTMLSWSSGKDSAWALNILRRDTKIQLVGLFTTINEAFDRVAMHAVRRELVEAQARSVGLPLHIITIPFPCPNAVYEERMGSFVERMRAEGVGAMAFGNLFLEDIRAYRQDRLKGTGILPLFPIWQHDTRKLATEMIATGLKAHVTCVDPRKLDTSFASRTFDAEFIAALPDNVDPCGENGEFHTFAFEGPMFQEPISTRRGEVVERDGFVFADLLSPDQVPS